MKQFDINLAKQGHPVQTRDGKPVRIICFDRKGNNPIVALVGDEEVIFWYDETGKQCAGIHGNKDLFMATTKHEGWINLYKDEDGTIRTGKNVHSSEKEAEISLINGTEYITTIKIEWEE